MRSVEQARLAASPADWMAWTVAGLILVSILVGGGGAEAPLQNGILAAGGAILLCLAAGRHLTGRSLPSGALVPLTFLLLFLLVILAQLVPLPPSWWQAMPGREAAARIYGLVESQPGWHPQSLDPESTRRFATALLLPAGLFVAACYASHRGLVLIAWAVVLGALLSVLAGTLQLGLGLPASLFPYEKPGAAVTTGLFANPNHQAQLMLAALVMTGFLIRVSPSRNRMTRRARLPFHPAWLLLPLFMAGAVMTQSRAGLILLLPALLAAVLIATRRRGLAQLFGMALMIVAALALIVALFPGGLARGLQLQLDLSAGGRITNFPDIFFTLGQFWPWGSGFGTFVPVFKANENLDLMGNLYLNHAHNDLLELLIEGGLPVAVLLGGTLIAIAARLWRLTTARDAPEPVTALTGLAIIAIASIHSLVDYPLRMPSLAAIFAIALAFLQSSAPRPDPRQRSPFLHRGFEPVASRLDSGAEDVSGA